MASTKHLDDTARTGGPSPLEMRALAIAGLLVVIIGVAGIWASLRPPALSAFSGRLSLTPLQVMKVMEQQLSGNGCPVALQQMQMQIDKRSANVVLPALGTFEVRAYYSGYVVVLPRSPVAEANDCRFNPRYIGPFA